MSGARRWLASEAPRWPRGAIVAALVAVVVSVVVLGLTGCLGGGAERAADRPVVVALAEEPENLNPVFGDIFGSFYGDKWPMFNGLLRRDENLELEPDLAAAPPEISEDGKTVTVRLRKGVRFHDGRELTADDVVFTYRSILDPKVATTLRDLLADVLARVEAVDRHTVRFSLKRLDPAFPDKLEFGIVPKHLLEGKDLNKASFNLKPIGTGPFVFKQFRRGDRLVLGANPGYFRGKPKVPRLVFAFVENENQRATLAENGGIDLDASAVSPRIAARLRGDPDLRVVRVPSDARVMVLPNDNAVLRDARVRRALGLAIDRRAIVDGVFQGAATPAYGPLMPGHWAHDPDLRASSDPGRARRELAAAGWRDRDRDDVLEKDGRELRFPLIYSAGSSVEKGTALAVRSDLAGVGVETELKGLGFDAMTDELGKGSAIINEQATVFDPELDFADLYASRFARDDEPFSNPAAVRDREIDRSIAGGASTLDRAKRIPPYHRLQRELLDNGGWHYLVRVTREYPVSRELQGVIPLRREGHLHGFSRAMLANVEDWSLGSGR